MNIAKNALPVLHLPLFGNTTFVTTSNRRIIPFSKKSIQNQGIVQILFHVAHKIDFLLHLLPG